MLERGNKETKTRQRHPKYTVIPETFPFDLALTEVNGNGGMGNIKKGMLIYRAVVSTDYSVTLQMVFFFF